MEQDATSAEQANDDSSKSDHPKIEDTDEQQNDNDRQENKENGDLIKKESSPEEQKETPKQQHAWFISRGAEICDVGEGLCTYIIIFLFNASFHCFDELFTTSIYP